MNRADEPGNAQLLVVPAVTEERHNQTIDDYLRRLAALLQTFSEAGIQRDLQGFLDLVPVCLANDRQYRLDIARLNG
jgi:hypothetical protein